ncbi:YfhO family protein [Lactiplantibacillus daowaiensis]|uniref:YfhO family protein n=1 Tax=Lactiplantibacillus daowaiensis TaxID=2559918 RepID=A0ABW1S1F1_9LACO|nr:YfhO family protein [Lactiplantibacillus daowaiensis]
MQREVRQRWLSPLIAGGLALLVISAVLWQKQITPFGNHNFLISDMGTQYLSFFTAYRHAILAHNFQLFSFSQSLGGTMIPTIAYYLMSPFNLIILAFNPANLPTGITVILMVKIMAIAVTMTIFLQAHFHTTRLDAAIFGVAFSMCGFVAMNYFDLMWLDALIWLPLILNGLDQLMATGHGAQFFGWLWLSIVTDFYLGYMTCLFVIYYFIYQLFETKIPDQPIWTSLVARRRQIGQVVLTAVLSGLSTLFLLIPTALGMLETAKTTNSSNNFLLAAQYKFNILSQLAAGASNYSYRLSHAPTIFSTTVVVLLVGAYFVQPLIQRAQKWHAASLLVALLLSMGIRLLDTVWHMFQQPEGFPFRDAFFFSFVMIMIAFASWQADPHRIAKKWQFGLPAGLIALLLIGWRANRTLKTAVTGHVLGLSLAYVVIGALVLFATWHVVQQLLLTGLVASELAGNFILSMRTTHFGSQSAYQTAYQTEYQQMRSVNDPDGQLYRVDNTNTLINRAYQEKYNNYNDPLLFNFHDINYYSSTLNEQTRMTLKSLGLYSKNARRISSQGLTPVSAMLLGIKYDVVLNAKGQATTKRNPTYLGMGFAINPGLNNVKLTQTHALFNQENILQSLRPSQAAYYRNATIISDHVTAASGAKLYHYWHTVRLKVTTAGPLYYDDTSGVTKYSTFEVNGKLVSPSVDANHHRLLLHLGDYSKGTVVTLKFKTKHQQLQPKVRLASLNLEQFKQVYQVLHATRFVPEYSARGLTTKVTGTMTNTNGTKWLYVALPYDQGWHAKVNGQTVTLKKTLGGLTAVPITSGKNTIRLQYHAPGLVLGSSISVISALGFAGYSWRRRKRARD